MSSVRYAHPIKPHQLGALYDRVLYLTLNNADKEMVETFTELGDVYVYWGVEPYGYAIVSGDLTQPLEPLIRVLSGYRIAYAELSTHYPGRSYMFMHIVYSSGGLCYFKLSQSRGSAYMVDAKCYTPKRHYPYDWTPEKKMPQMEEVYLNIFTSNAMPETVNDAWRQYSAYTSRLFGFSSKAGRLVRQHKVF